MTQVDRVVKDELDCTGVYYQAQVQAWQQLFQSSKACKKSHKRHIGIYNQIGRSSNRTSLFICNTSHHDFQILTSLSELGFPCRFDTAPGIPGSVCQLMDLRTNRSTNSISKFGSKKLPSDKRCHIVNLSTGESLWERFDFFVEIILSLILLKFKTDEVGKSRTIQAGSWGHSLCLHSDKIASAFRDFRTDWAP